ncbi:hypothetical protein KUTeg_001294 [Tegillarca granosa]|uniref:Uncharacterized protein n=1 Tax=Tegillarca granosa TaxID=220873 RepID=A0ABQ9FV92_TEGGR|nr:hypothetical protein KUTeg_001294 [Tegillarca granosa]
MAVSWPPDVPSTLEDICLNYCVEHLENFITYRNQELSLIPNIILPADLCDKLFFVLYEKFQPGTSWMSIFSDPYRSQLGHVILKRCQVNSEQLNYICNHPLTELDLSFCKIYKEFIGCINKLTRTLKTLKFEGSGSGLLEAIENTIEETSPEACSDSAGVFGRDYIFNCPNLRVLSIRDVPFQESSYGHDILGTMLCPLIKLTHLDLSRCSIELQYMDCLEELKSLLSLNLHGVIISDLQEALHNICKVKTLRHLDLSQEVDEHTPNQFYASTNIRLKYIVDHLPYLTSLDISGTDLAGIELNEPKCGIKGLEGRSFDFLGLLDCSDSACKREGIPAKKITGDANEDQILLSIQRYVDRRSLLASGLNNLFQLFSASLFYIVKGDHKEKITQSQKRTTTRKNSCRESVMLEIIQRKLQMGTCDEILEVAWSTLWNVTDETAKNCFRFMNGKGMEYFLKCLMKFPDKPELLRNMMGLMGNIAEVKDLRPKLMIPDYITVFSDLLDSKSDGIEVSYNSAGMLAHIISDGEKYWTISCPSRGEASETPAAQYWAVWALCNLTKVYPEKYCSLLKSEDGVEILKMVIGSDSTMSEVKELANRVLNLIVRYKGQDLDDEDMLVNGAVGHNKDDGDGDVMHVIEDDEVSSDEN